MNRFLTIVRLFFIVISGGAHAATINVNGTDAGRPFEGIGAVSAGANSRLLIDYPEPYRSDILDFLFKPKFGASFHYMKVELGGGSNSTSGAEPSHAITRAEVTDPVSRGYEFWLMKQARQRNPQITLDFLPWTFSYWVGSPFSQKQDYADYFTAFMKEARDQWGVTVNWVSAAKNEHHTDLDWIANYLRPTMDAAGFHDVNIQAPDGLTGQAWGLFDDVINNPSYNAAVEAIGYHYIDQGSAYPTAEMIASGKPLWCSEDSVGGGAWHDGREIVRRMNKLYANGRITLMEIWCPIDSCDEGVLLADVGFIDGDTPWSGYYNIRPALWGVAHYTQFTQPGWLFIDGACGNLTSWGNYATLKDPASNNWSMIIYSEVAETLTVNLTGGLSIATVHVWKSNPTQQFVQQSDIVPSGGSFTINVEAESLYSLTTTTGQQKGTPAHPIPADTAFPFPYSQDFESCAVGTTPPWLSDMGGTFEVAACKGGRTGKCLQQMMPLIGDTWFPSWCQPKAAMTLFGSMAWANYEISADVLIEQGEVYLAARKGAEQTSAGYAFTLDKFGNWRLSLDTNTTLKSGTIGSFNGAKWHNLKVRAIFDQIDAYVDNIRIASVVDVSRAAGQPCLGGSYNLNQYDNLHVYPAGPATDQWTKIDDRHPSLVWINVWGKWSQADYYYGTCKYSETIGSAVEFPFYGRYGRVYGLRRDDLGFIDVYLDGILQTSVDCYNSTTYYQTLLYQTNELALGNHTIRVEVSGNQNPSSKGFEIVLDAFASSQTSAGWCFVEPLDEPSQPSNLPLPAVASSSSDWSIDYTANKANDGNWSTRWNSAPGDVNGAWLQLDFGAPKTFGQAKFQQYDPRVQSYLIQYEDNGQWKDAYVGGPMSTSPETVIFDSVTGTKARLLVVTSTTVPTIFEFQLFAPVVVQFTPLYVDLNGDGQVTLADMAQLCSVWLQDNCSASCDCDKADLFHDGRIDLFDFSVLAGQINL